MSDVEIIRVVLYEGPEIAAAFTISPSCDGTCHVVYERGDNTYNRGVATAIAVSLSHLWDLDRGSVSVGMRIVADALIEEVVVKQESWPF